ncbi:hypothetical protein BDV96DRAFT_571429 [Lophiotrema nucula]|uniref:Uncharacterized protein n=1 Tax=Lophiotrema nucula TaxID=690887 RepID=A0A6A5ZDA0_9PLEO|nr:hypothetical protein BDV96DRAFT_571429 [Lophiotrema nucula]
MISHKEVPPWLCVTYECSNQFTKHGYRTLVHKKQDSLMPTANYMYQCASFRRMCFFRTSILPNECVSLSPSTRGNHAALACPSGRPHRLLLLNSLNSLDLLGISKRHPLPNPTLAPETPTLRTVLVDFPLEIAVADQLHKAICQNRTPNTSRRWI